MATVYWLLVRLFQNAEPKRLTFASATERALMVISLTAQGVEIIGEGVE